MHDSLPENDLSSKLNGRKDGDDCGSEIFSCLKAQGEEVKVGVRVMDCLLGILYQ